MTLFCANDLRESLQLTKRKPCDGYRSKRGDISTMKIVRMYLRNGI